MEKDSTKTDLYSHIDEHSLQLDHSIWKASRLNCLEKSGGMLIKLITYVSYSRESNY